MEKWFRRFRSGIFYVKDASRTDKPIEGNVSKIMNIVESDRHGSTVSIAQELKIALVSRRRWMNKYHIS